MRSKFKIDDAVFYISCKQSFVKNYIIIKIGIVTGIIIRKEETLYEVSGVEYNAAVTGIKDIKEYLNLMPSYTRINEIIKEDYIGYNFKNIKSIFLKIIKRY